MDSTTVCNLALSKIGDQSITSLTDGSLEARFCNLYYPVVLQEVLMMHPWNFATKLANLTRLANIPVFDWAFQYELPNDYGRLIAFNDFDSADPVQPFEIQGNLFLTDQNYAAICYVSTAPDPSLFTPTFVQVVAIKLAADLCKPLSGSYELKNSLMQEFKTALADAGKINANDSRPKKRELWVDSPLVASRFGGYLP